MTNDRQIPEFHWSLVIKTLVIRPQSTLAVPQQTTTQMLMSARYNANLWQIRHFRSERHNRSIFSAVIGMLLAMLAGGNLAQGQGHTVKTSPASPPPLPAPQLIAQSAANLLSLTGLEAEFRYRVTLFDETLQGTGHFWQKGEGPEKQFRLELKTQLEEGTATQQIICGSQYLWIRREVSGQKKPLPLVRIQLRRLRKTLQEAGPPLAIDPSPTWLGIVTLPKLMGSLNMWFNYAPPEEANISNRLVWQLKGEMIADLREKILIQGKSGKHSGEQIPNHVRLTLGRDAELPLFPYRLEFLRSTAKDPTPQTMLALEFFSVKVKSEIDPQLFEYAPGDQEVEDQTVLFLQRLGFMVKE